MLSPLGGCHQSLSSFGALLTTYSLFTNFISKLKSPGTCITALRDSVMQRLWQPLLTPPWGLWMLKMLINCPWASGARNRHQPQVTYP